MKNKFLLRDEFLIWLVNEAKLPMPTANSYCIYVAAVDKYTKINRNDSYDNSNFFSVLEFAVNNGDSQDILTIIDAMLSFLSLDNINEILDSSLKYIKNWKSGLYQYKEFLYYYVESKKDENINITSAINSNYTVSPLNNFVLPSIEELLQELEKADKSKVKKVNNLSTIKKVYSKLDLYENFKFRIITQDRYYDTIFYPISFIKRYFYYTGSKEYFDNWVTELLDKVNVHHEDGTIKLKKITKLEIVNNSISVHFNNESKSLFTKDSDNKSLLPLSVSLLSKIALDHEKPLLNIMNENIDRFVTFNQITKELKKHIPGKVNIKKLKSAYNIVFHTNFINEISLEDIKAEMSLLSSLTNLQLMESSKNSSKGVFDYI